MNVLREDRVFPLTEWVTKSLATSEFQGDVYRFRRSNPSGFNHCRVVIADSHASRKVTDALGFEELCCISADDKISAVHTAILVLRIIIMTTIRICP